MLRGNARCGAVVLALCLAASTASATQVLLQSPAEMGSSADLVVQGTVRSVTSAWNAQHTRILTKVDVAVDRPWKGSAPSSVTVVQWGGVVDAVRMTVAGAPQWREGEEVVLFLERGDDLGYRVSGFSQGRFLVERDERTGETFVRRPALTGVELFETPGKLADRGAGGAHRIPLRSLLAEALPASSEGR